jgi:hypothetical protein
MSIIIKLRAIRGIKKFLDKFDIPLNLLNERILNELFLDFAKENKIEGFQPPNSKRYKGSCEPALYNAILIQNNFQAFKKFIENKYNTK